MPRGKAVRAGEGQEMPDLLSLPRSSFCGGSLARCSGSLACSISFAPGARMHGIRRHVAFELIVLWTEAYEFLGLCRLADWHHGAALQS